MGRTHKGMALARPLPPCWAGRERTALFSLTWAGVWPLGADQARRGWLRRRPREPDLSPIWNWGGGGWGGSGSRLVTTSPRTAAQSPPGSFDAMQVRRQRGWGAAWGQCRWPGTSQKPVLPNSARACPAVPTPPRLLRPTCSPTTSPTRARSAPARLSLTPALSYSLSPALCHLPVPPFSGVSRPPLQPPLPSPSGYRTTEHH